MTDNQKKWNQAVLLKLLPQCWEMLSPSSTRGTENCFWRSAGSLSCPRVLERSLRLRAWDGVHPCRLWFEQWSRTSRGSCTTTMSFLKSTPSWFATTSERKSSSFPLDRSGVHRLFRTDWNGNVCAYFTWNIPSHSMWTLFLLLTGVEAVHPLRAHRQWVSWGAER